MEFNTKYVTEPNAKVVQGKYQDGTVGLSVFSDIGEKLCNATVFLGAYNLTPAPGNVFVYGDYSEHEGVQAALQRAGIVGSPLRQVDYGPYNAYAFECQLLIDNELETT